MTSTSTYSAIITLVGRPNVGKSTLLNHLVGRKISITSRKKQTTRYAIRGIKTEANRQMVFVDTPGLHFKQCTRLNASMNQAARDALADVDLVLMLIEAGKISAEDAWVLKLISEQKVPKILLINKVDQLKDKKVLLPQITEISGKASELGMEFREIIPLSAFVDEDVRLVQQEIMKRLPESPFLFPADMLTDLDEHRLISEIIREQLIRFTGKELPYQTHVLLEQNKTEQKARHRIRHIDARIYVERPGQKPIILGKNGARLKQIATLARHNIEKIIGCQVMLRLWIKVKPDWTNDKLKLQQLGYTLRE